MVALLEADIAANVKNLQAQQDADGWISAADLFARGIDTIPTLIEIVPKYGIAVIAGSSDTGKSSFLRHFGLCIVSGRDFLGWPINATYGRVLYVSTEDDEEAMTPLIRKQAKAMGLTADDMQGFNFLFDTDNLLVKLDKRLTREPVDVVFLDCFSDLFGGDTNKDTAVRGFMEDFRMLAAKHKCLMFFLHHTGKGKEDFTPSKNNLLGSRAIEAKSRLAIELKTDNADPDTKHLCVVKANYLPAKYKQESYDLTFSDDLIFTSLGSRTPFERLQKVSNRVVERYGQIIELKEQGKTYEEIGAEIGCSKGNVSKIMKKTETAFPCFHPLGNGNGNKEKTDVNDDAELPF